MKNLSVQRLAVIALVGVILGGAIYAGGSYFASDPKPMYTVEIKTAGSSVVHFVMDKWRQGYKKEKEVFVDFASKGSTEGINMMIDRHVDIGFTHAPMNDEQKKKAKDKGGEVLHIPVAISAIVPIYNVKELKGKDPVKFTGEVLAKIFLGDIKTWDAPELLAINPEMAELKKDGKLGSVPIIVVHREDKSGTTQIFTDYLQEVSEPWRTKVGPAKDKVEWPTGTGKKRSDGVASHVVRTEGAIGYVEVLHARAQNIPYGAMENKDSIAKKEFKDKIFIHVTPENVTAAANEIVAEIPEDLTFKLTNKPGAKSYPICAGAWAVCYQTQPAAREKLVKDFLLWVTHEGQKPAYNVWTHDPRSTYAAAAIKEGAVTHIFVKPGAISYNKAPAISITGGGTGKGASAKAKVVGGELVAIELVSGGSGYTSPPFVTIEPTQEEMLFSPLPAKLVERVDQRLKTMKSQ